MLSILWLVPLFLRAALGNVEKTIFIAPPPEPITSQKLSLDDSGLARLSPETPVVRTYLNATFPSDQKPRGTDSWFLLDTLNPGQRYEVRICWLATQPTVFSLYTHTLSEVLDSPSLISSIVLFSDYHGRLDTDGLLEGQNQLPPPQSHQSPVFKAPGPKTLLFLHIYAAADYFTLNETLMTDVPPVHVDIILDPYVLNIFPRSLVPTALYVITVATGAWYLSRLIWAGIADIVQQQDTQIVSRDKKSI